MYGLGHDPISGDYKIVELSYWDTDNEYNLDCANTFVDVYYVGRGIWRRADNSPYDHAVPHLACGAFMGGKIRWLASSREEGYASVIAAFDLAREVFDEMPAPKDVDVGKFVFYKLVFLSGCLCLVDAQRDITRVWVMKEYGAIIDRRYNRAVNMNGYINSFLPCSVPTGTHYVQLASQGCIIAALLAGKSSVISGV
ncbi:hypothetical protein SASPL_105247 [Salvia splendens]|uniref:F-box associated beta-propeller type 3 domain-containing protein n=1 Tax=Salvia splendens TaxID=180675 RepID=A0A8X9A955_SALSN|nr:hypothetical protein SASPL_105247 [Salvia splendens]